MDAPQTQADLERLIKDEIEESLTLDYKAAGALMRTDTKKKELTKDVSAMANSAGGLIIYGIREHSDPARQHKPEAIDPINRTAFSKEWIEQIINLIRPKLDVRIHPITLNTGATDVAYAVEIPQSDTAHQAWDLRYYKRFNFLSEAMSDYEIRDIMGRSKTAIFEIHSAITFTARYPPGYGDFRIILRLSNAGKITAYDVTVAVEQLSDLRPLGAGNFTPHLWDWKSETQTPTILSKYPIHPRADQTIGHWELGIGVISAENVTACQGDISKMQACPATYQGQAVKMLVRVSTKDQAEVTGLLQYSKGEIEAGTRKRFPCEALGQD